MFCLVPARLPGWETAFVRVMESHLARPFEWGISDCLIIPADLCLGMTGVDPMKGSRRYSSETGALRMMARKGCADVEQALASAFAPIDKLLARRADCGVLEQMVDGKPMLSTLIVMGEHALGKGPHGPISVPVSRLRSTFAIGAL